MAGHETIEKDVHLDCPVLSMVSTSSYFDEEWSERAFTSDTVLDPVVIAQRSLGLSDLVTIARFPGKHDLVLSDAPVREAVYATMRGWPASEEYRARVPVEESTSMSARRSVRKLSLMGPVCHADARREAGIRCADGRARPWPVGAGVEGCGALDKGEAEAVVACGPEDHAGSGSSRNSLGKGVTGTGMRSMGGRCGLTTCSDFGYKRGDASVFRQ